MKKDKYNGMKHAADWLGKRVRAVRTLRNCGGQGVTPGMLGTVRGVYAGLDITFDVCKHCGTVIYVARVGYHDVELAE